MSTLTVIMPNFNHAKELQISLGAIVAQSRLPDEIIVIDDGSTDDSLAVIDGFAARCSAVRVLRHGRNLGVVAALNLGVAEATGDYVMFASADEWISTEMCGELLTALQRMPQASLAVSRHTEWFPETNEITAHDHSSELGMWYVQGNEPVLITPERLHALLAQRYVALGIHTAMFRRQAIIEAGGFDAAIKWHSDWFLIYAIAFKHGFVAVPRHLAWFRVSPMSYSAAGVRDSGAQLGVAVAILRRLGTPVFSSFKAALMRSPQAFSPVMRSTILALAMQPREYRLLLRLTAFWLGEVMRGRRPGSLARAVAKLSGRPWEPARTTAPPAPQDSPQREKRS